MRKFSFFPLWVHGIFCLPAYEDKALLKSNLSAVVGKQTDGQD